MPTLKEKAKDRDIVKIPLKEKSPGVWVPKKRKKSRKWVPGNKPGTWLPKVN